MTIPPPPVPVVRRTDLSYLRDRYTPYELYKGSSTHYNARSEALKIARLLAGQNFPKNALPSEVARRLRKAFHVVR